MSTKLLDYTVAGTPVREWPRVAAEMVAPRLLWRWSMGTTPRQVATEVIESRDWDELAELVYSRIVTGRDLRAVAAGRPDITYAIGVGLLARVTTWVHRMVADGQWGPEWNWYLRRHIDRVNRALRALEATW